MAYVKTKLKKDIVIDSIITVHYFEYMKNFVFRGETHDFWEFLYVDQGKVLVTAGDKQHVLDQGNVIFHMPNEFHAIKSIGNVAPNLIAISFSSRSAALSLLNQKILYLSYDERYLISHIIDAAKKTFSTSLNLPSVEQVLISKNAPFGSEQMIQLYIELFLLSVIQTHCCQNEDSFQLPTRCSLHSKKDIHQAILQHLEEHVCDTVSVDELCRCFSISSTSLQNIFHKEHHCGVMHFFTEQKIAYAKKLIRNGNKNISEIAYCLSYSSPSHFSKAFKSVTGMSPRSYCSSVRDLLYE